MSNCSLIDKVMRRSRLADTHLASRGLARGLVAGRSRPVAPQVCDTGPRTALPADGSISRSSPPAPLSRSGC